MITLTLSPLDGSPEAIMSKIKDEGALNAARHALKAVHKLSLQTHGPQNMSADGSEVNVRCFLAAYAITFCPAYVLRSTEGDLEKSLMSSAKALVEDFDKIASAIHNNNYSASDDIPADLTVNFTPLFWAYLSVFREWKARDEAILVADIKRALVAIVTGRRAINDPQGAQINLDTECKIQIANCLQKLEKLTSRATAQAFCEQHNIDFENDVAPLWAADS